MRQLARERGDGHDHWNILFSRGVRLESEGQALIIFSILFRVSEGEYLGLFHSIPNGNLRLSYSPFLVLIDISLIISFIKVNLKSFTSPEVSTVIHTCLFALLDLSSNAL